MSDEQKEGNFEAFVEKIKRKRRRKGDGDATVPIDDPIRPNTDESAVELPLPTVKETLTVAENATTTVKSEEKNYAEFLLARSGNMLACRRSSCGRKAYPIGGTLGSLTLEQMAERQGWRVTKSHKIYSELLDGKRVAWFSGNATLLRKAGAHPIWSDRANVERSDHIHDNALEVLFENG